MKRMILKSVCALALVAFCATGASAQGFLKKLKKAAETVTSVTGTGEQAADTTAASAADSISPKELAATMPMYRVVEVDQTVQKYYLLLDQNDKVCDASTARKHLKSAMKSGAAILAKVGVGAAAGALAAKGSGGSKKKAWLSAGIGAAMGLAAASGDIKELKQQLKLRKECLRVIAQYQKDFTDEGLPVDAAADLSAYQDCETMTLPAAQVQQELLASQEEGGSMEDFSDEELEKLLSEENA